MSALRVGTLILRLIKGTKLSHAELDGNFVRLRDFSNALADIIDTALNPDGTVKKGAVGRGAIGQRVVLAENMGFKSALFAVDTGTVNTIKVAFDPVMEAYEDGTILFIYTSTEPTGPVKVKVDSLDEVNLLKGNSPLSAGDFKKNAIIAIGYYGGNFRMVGTIATTATADTTTPLSIVYDSPQGLPGNGLTATFTHGLGYTPETYALYLRCKDIGGDAGYTFGQRIPIGDAVDSGAVAAFSFTASVADIVVTQHTAAVEVPDPTPPGSNVAIDETKWEIEVVIRNAVSASSLMSPPLTLQVVDPMGGICHGTDLFALVAGGKSWVRVDLTTAQTVSTVNPATAHTFASVSLFLSDAKHQVIYCATGGGIFRFDTAVPAVLTELGSHGNLPSYGPVEIDEVTAPAAAATPDVYAIEENKLTTALVLRKLTTHGGAPAGNTVVGTTASLRDGTISNIAAYTANATVNSNMRWIGWNPIKKRLYLVTENSGLVHIFKFTATSLHAWWAAPNYTQVAYEKAIIIAGVPSNDAYYQYERMGIEFDLVTGQEKSVTFGRYPKAKGMGTVTRSPWVEG